MCGCWLFWKDPSRAGRRGGSRDHSRTKIESQAQFWSAPMVATWLNLIGLSEYVPRFLENGVDGPTLLDLRKDQFERCLGLSNPLHEASLLWALDDLKGKVIDYTTWEWNCTGVMQWLSTRGLELLIGRFQSAAVHGSVLFRLSKADFASRLHVGELGESELILDSLWYSVQRARKVGYYQEQGNFLDWGPLEIRGWLESINLGHLNDTFREHAVNGTLLPYLDGVKLRRIMKLTEIQTLVLTKAIQRLKRGEVLQMPMNTASSISSSAQLPYAPMTCYPDIMDACCQSPESTSSGYKRFSDMDTHPRKSIRQKGRRSKENGARRHHSSTFTPNFDENDLAIQI